MPRTPPRAAPTTTLSRLSAAWSQAMFALPNLFTCSSIFCGFFAMVLVSGTPGPVQFHRATLAIFFAMFFDMADGRVARLTRTQSAFGVQLDSLADIVSFGAAPALIVYHWGLAEVGVGKLVAFIYLACGAIRLARFNVLVTRQGRCTDAERAGRAAGADEADGTGKWFVGLPIPLAAGMLVALVMFHQKFYAAPIRRQQHIVALTLILSCLMVSNVPYRTFKQAQPTARNFAAFCALLATFTALALLFWPSFALLVFFGAYIAVGPTERLWAMLKRGGESF